jgi:hypothetical protein
MTDDPVPPHVTLSVPNGAPVTNEPEQHTTPQERHPHPYQRAYMNFRGRVFGAVTRSTRLQALPSAQLAARAVLPVLDVPTRRLAGIGDTFISNCGYLAIGTIRAAYFAFGRMYWPTTGNARLALRPSKKSIRRMVETIHQLTDRRGAWQETTELVGKLNRTLRGWTKYFDFGWVTKAYRALDNYTAVRLPGGCVTSTKLGGDGAGPIQTRTYTGTSGSCA